MTFMKGQGYWTGKHRSEKSKQKMSESYKRRGTIPPSRKGTTHSEETKMKMSKTHLARKERLGYINSPETRRRMSEAGKGKYPSEESRQKMSESRLKRKNN